MNLLKVAQAMVFIGAIAFTMIVEAKDVQIFGVKKTLPLTNDEPVYQDFYLNAGKETGIKKGMIISVYRRETLYDSFQNKTAGDLKVPVGKIKIIHVQGNISVARLYSLVGRKAVPVLDYNYILVGDLVDLKTAKMDRGKPRKTASIEENMSESFKTTLEKAVGMPSTAGGEVSLPAGLNL